MTRPRGSRGTSRGKGIHSVEGVGTADVPALGTTDPTGGGTPSAAESGTAGEGSDLCGGFTTSGSGSVGPCAFCNTTDPAAGWTVRTLAEPVTFHGTFGTVAILPAGTWAVCSVCSTWLDGDHWDHPLPAPLQELLDTTVRAARLHPTTGVALRAELVGQARHLAAAFHPVPKENTDDRR